MLSPVDKWIEELEQMRYLSPTELEYSCLYCNPVNMLAKIKHDTDRPNISNLWLLSEQIRKIENIFSVCDIPPKITDKLKEIKAKLEEKETGKEIEDIQDDVCDLCNRAEKIIKPKINSII